MEFEKQRLAGIMLITPRVFKDERGFFLERHVSREFRKNGIAESFVQLNESRSLRFVVRGLHFQAPPKAQDKLVWVTRGSVLDAVVDVRAGSPTYGEWEQFELSEENKRMLFIPKGFAHGFAVQSAEADFSYLVSEYYAPECDGGIRWNDPSLGIDWGIADPIVSEKDSALPLLSDFTSPF